ncbi:MAG: phosphoribosylamine--glycine ligase, partial [Chloroflexota bacterium]
MGAYSPTRLVPPDVLDDVLRRIVRPAVAGMGTEGRPFTGFLYAGLMFTADGPQVIEFNARFGDPEAQAILPLLESDLVELIEAALDRRLDGMRMRWRDDHSCAVCLASTGYPDAVRDGVPVHGLETAVRDGVPVHGLETVDEDALVFHAGTVERDGQIITHGGRILTVVGLGATLAGARRKAYGTIERIRFDGMQYRQDIGEREDLTPLAPSRRRKGNVRATMRLARSPFPTGEGGQGVRSEETPEDDPTLHPPGDGGGLDGRGEGRHLDGGGDRRLRGVGDTGRDPAGRRGQDSAR